MTRAGLVILILSLLAGCSKPPDLEAPCREFGKHCSQQPINEEDPTSRDLFAGSRDLVPKQNPWSPRTSRGTSGY